MTARVYRFVTAASNNLQRIGLSPNKLVGAALMNAVDAPFYVKIWFFKPVVGGAQSPTVGTTPPDLVLCVPASDPAAGADGCAYPSWPGGIAQAGAQIWVACVTGIADSDNTSVASGQGNINLLLE